MRSLARIEALAPIALAIAMTASCSDGGASSPALGGDGRDDGGSDAAPPSGPWYDTALDPDTSYLPMGPSAFSKVPLDWKTPEGDAVRVDAYMPSTANAPVVVFLPGAYVVKERYTWIGSVLASHGVLTLVVQPPDAFPRTVHAAGSLTALAKANADASSPLHGKADLTRVVLSGHSIGSLVQADFTNASACAPGFCTAGVALPGGVRGLLLFAFHAENPDGPKDTTPLPAIEVPWLTITGSKDGLTTPDKAAATFAREQDRPSSLIEVEGMNHYQFTDYVDPKIDAELPRDGTPTVTSKAARAAAATYAVAFVKRTLLADTSIPEDLGAASDARVKAQTKPTRVPLLAGSDLPRVRATPFATPGFGNHDSIDVVATKSFQGATYLLVRNDTTGAEVWRIKDGKAETAGFPAPSKWENGLIGAMEVFQNKLWVGFSSGVQGSKRGSIGAQVWTYDGAAWAPFVANAKDADPTVTLASCAKGAGTSVTLTVTGAALTAGAWVGDVVDEVDGTTGDPVELSITANSDGTITARDDETIGAATSTACDTLKAGETLALRKGLDENGFGQPWNKAIWGMAAWGGKLYVATALNYQDGAEVYATDGSTITVAVPRAFFGTHPDGSPKSSSITGLFASKFDGTDALYVAANGTQNYGARLARIPAGGAPVFVVDDAVSGGPAMTKAGFGRGTFQIGGLEEFAGRLWATGFDFNGAEVFSAAKLAGASADWRVEVGQGAKVARGFGDPLQITAALHAHAGQLWVGGLANVSSASDLVEKSAIGARTGDGAAWQLTTTHGFGVNAVAISRFFEQDGALFAVASGGDIDHRGGFAPFRLYTLTDEPSATAAPASLAHEPGGAR